MYTMVKLPPSSPHFNHGTKWTKFGQKMQNKSIRN